MRSEPVSPEERRRRLDVANAQLVQISERWLTARARGIVPEKLDRNLSDAIQTCRRAQRHVRDDA